MDRRGRNASTIHLRAWGRGYCTALHKILYWFMITVLLTICACAVLKANEVLKVKLTRRTACTATVLSSRLLFYRKKIPTEKRGKEAEAVFRRSLEKKGTCIGRIMSAWLIILWRTANTGSRQIQTSSPSVLTLHLVITWLSSKSTTRIYNLYTMMAWISVHRYGISACESKMQLFVFEHVYFVLFV